jgi:formamidopyrimidine-DNA glycosylase
LPELPEARTIARGLHAAVAGAAVAEIRLLRRDMLKTGTPRALAGLAGQTILSVGTRGKYIVMHLTAARLVIQLGMSGQMRLVPPRAVAAPTHTHLIIRLADRRAIFYVNTRRIASGLHVLDGGREDAGPMAALGPEATDISAAAFIAASSKSRRAIKTALMDSRLMAGVGNIYSDEALFRAGIRPTRRANTIPAARLRVLHRAVGQVLREALAAGGSSLADANPYVDADGQLGEFSMRHRVYGRAGQACLSCGTTLKSVRIGGRTSTFCPKCQK